MAVLASRLGKREINQHFTVRNAKWLSLAAVALLLVSHTVWRYYDGESSARSGSGETRLTLMLRLLTRRLAICESLPPPPPIGQLQLACLYLLLRRPSCRLKAGPDGQTHVDLFLFLSP